MVFPTWGVGGGAGKYSSGLQLHTYKGGNHKNNTIKRGVINNDKFCTTKNGGGGV